MKTAKTRTVLLLSILWLTAACRSAAPVVPEAPKAPIRNDLMNSVLWMQTSAEADALRLQVFVAARQALDEALADPRWTAADEQTGAFEGLPPAVIVDVDETILDNSALEARFITRDQSFTPQIWSAWVEERKATASPGALEFARYAAERGVTMFYVTNRSIEEEPATRDNLRKVGFPIDDTVDVILTKGENGAPSDKTSRRAIVASTHRILLMMGDDLGDFTSRSGSIAERRERMLANQKRWGRQWFVLPNPMYGSWEQALEHGAAIGGSVKLGALDEALD